MSTVAELKVEHLRQLTRLHWFKKTADDVDVMILDAAVGDLFVLILDMEAANVSASDQGNPCADPHNFLEEDNG